MRYIYIYIYNYYGVIFSEMMIVLTCLYSIIVLLLFSPIGRVLRDSSVFPLYKITLSSHMEHHGGQCWS